MKKETENDFKKEKAEKLLNRIERMNKRAECTKECINRIKKKRIN